MKSSLVVLVVEGESDERRDGLLGLEVAEVQLRLDLADAGIGLLQHRPVQSFLVAEVIVDHPLAGGRLGGDLVDAGAAQSVRGEFGARDLENAAPDALRILDAPRG